jgi:hypothetical protein
MRQGKVEAGRGGDPPRMVEAGPLNSGEAEQAAQVGVEATASAGDTKAEAIASARD